MHALIVDDHPLLRRAIKEIVVHHFPLSVVWEAATGDEAITVVKTNPVDVAILDIRLPDYSGLMVLQKIKQLRASVKCLVLTIHDEPHYVRLAMAHGASGYLTKEATSTELHEAIVTVLSGRQAVMEQLSDTLSQQQQARHGMVWLHESLSAREMEVLVLLARGRTASQVAAKLRLSVKTVSTYRTRLLDKLGLKTTADLIRYAVDHRLVR
jgi:two-component system, NarL family, invasion response regulator UvrY